MAKKLIYNYTFDASAQTVVIKGLYKLRTLQLITNVTDQTIIFNFADTNKGGTTSYNSTTDETTITLEYNTTTMSDSDELQIFVDTQENKIDASESLLDPVHKFRVSNPENLIDTDFEYGLQPTKWETLELVNNIPSVYTRAPGVSIGGISQVNTLANSDEVTVVCTINHDLAIGDPIEVQGTSVRTVNGKYIITAIPSDTSLIYRASSEQSTSANVKTAYTTIIPGSFFTGSSIEYEKTKGIETDGANLSTLSLKTEYNHGLTTSTSLYITNTVGKRSISIAQTSATAPDGDPFVDTTDNDIYSANHSLYTNQTIFLSADTGGTLPTTSGANGEPTTDSAGIEGIFDAVSTAADAIVTAHGNNHARIYGGYNYNNTLAIYTNTNYNIYPRAGSASFTNDIQTQYLTYGEYSNSTSIYDYLYLYNSSNSFVGGYRWTSYGEGNTDILTGNAVDLGQYFGRYSGSGPTTLANKGYWYKSTRHNRGFHDYILTVHAFPDPSTVLSTASRQRRQFESWRYKYSNTSAGYSGYYLQNTRQNAGDGWYYTYNCVYYRGISYGSHYVKFNILLENDNWNAQYGGNTVWANYSMNREWSFGAALASNTANHRGQFYVIELMMALDEDTSNSYYSTSLFATRVANIVAEVKSNLTTTGLNAVGINTLRAEVVDVNRFKLKDLNGNILEFSDPGGAPLKIETAQTTGVVDDYYNITGITSTTVSIGVSNKIVSRELTFSNTDVVEDNSDYYINISTGHGLNNLQKLTFTEVSGASIPGLTSGTEYYSIVQNDKYIRLGVSTDNAISATNAITSTQATSGSYKLTVPGVAGRVAAAGTVTTSESSTAVTGTNTKFQSTYSVGDQFTIIGVGGTFASYTSNEIASIVSDTSLILRNQPGITTTGVEHFVDTKINVRADGTFIHRPFDGGVDITAGTSPDSKIIRQTRKYFRYQSGKGIQCSMAINFNPYQPARLVEGSGTTVTVTTEYPHNLTAGDTIKFRGASDSNYNGTNFTVANPTTFTFQYTAGGTVSETSPTGFMEWTINTYSGAAVRAGLFDDQNGFFFEYDGSDLACVRRSSVQQLSGTAIVTYLSNKVLGTNTRFQDQLSVDDRIVIRGQTYKVTAIHGQDEIDIQPKYRGTSNNGVIMTLTQDTKVAQSSWNIDKADGSGPSGYILDINSIQMAYLDYSWYGAGKIRFGFKDTYGHVKYMHEFIHNNRLNEAYMRTGNVPARYEVANTTAQPTFVPSLFHWGTSVIMDGGFDDDDSYLFTASGNTLTFTNGDSDTATTTADGEIYRVRKGYGLNDYYLKLTFSNADSAKFTTGIPLYTADEELNGQTVYYAFNSGSSFLVYIFLETGYEEPGVYPIVPSGTSVSVGAPATGGSDVDLNSLIPLISIRLAPSADNNLIGELGERDIINRMQLKMQEMGISVSHDSRISVILNGSLSNLNHENVGSPSLSQYTAHDSGDTIQGGTTIYQFRASGGSIGSSGERTVASETFDLSRLIDLGNSILGGDGVFPNGPDVITICTTALDTTSVNGDAPYQVSSRISWAESQA